MAYFSLSFKITLLLEKKELHTYLNSIVFATYAFYWHTFIYCFGMRQSKWNFCYNRFRFASLLSSKTGFLNQSKEQTVVILCFNLWKKPLWLKMTCKLYLLAKDMASISIASFSNSLDSMFIISCTKMSLTCSTGFSFILLKRKPSV